MSDIFLSYSSKDLGTAKALAGALEQHGWSVWWDRRIPTGRDYAEVIESELAASRCVIVLWSANSVASEWVKTEAADAKDRRLLVPVLIEPVRIPLEFRRIQAADLTGWKGETTHAGFSTLVTDLTGILGAPRARVSDPEARPSVKTSYGTYAAADAEGGAGAGAAEVHAARADPPQPVREPTEQRPAEAEGNAVPPPQPVEAEIEPPTPQPDDKAPHYLLSYGRLVAAGVAVLFVAGILWVVYPSNDRGYKTNNVNASPTATPRTAASATPPPAGNDNQTPPANVSPNPDRVRRLGLLLTQINSRDERERRRVTSILKDEYGSDPQAVEQALAMLDESRLGELSPQGLINVIFFLNNTQDDAWTFGSAERALKTVDAIGKRPVGKQASEELSKFRTRADYLLKKTKSP